MKYFIGKASPSFVGAERTWKFIAENKEKTNEFFQHTAIEHIESHEDVSKYEEENDVEYEYKYHIEEISKEEFDKLEYELLD